MQRTQEQKKLISCLHLIFQAVRKYVIKLIDILANFICIHGGIYFFWEISPDVFLGNVPFIVNNCYGGFIFWPCEH